MRESIDHPEHYNKGKTEAIVVIDDILSQLKDKPPIILFCLGNAIKYLFRAGHKNDFIDDIKKAIWYLEEIVRRHETEEYNKWGLMFFIKHIFNVVGDAISSIFDRKNNDQE